MKNLITILSIAFIATCGTMKAQKPAVVVSDKTGWHKITETSVSFEKETDEVSVLLADKFASLKFKVTDATIDIRDVEVLFEDGTKQQITIGNHIKKPGEASREIDIEGAGEKRIASIILKYATLKTSKDQKGHVEIWGKKTNADKAAKMEEKKAEHAEKKAEKKAEKIEKKEAKKN